MNKKYKVIEGSATMVERELNLLKDPIDKSPAKIESMSYSNGKLAVIVCVHE